MKVFLVEFKGHFLGGQCVIVDETKRKAYNKAIKYLEKEKLLSKNEDFSIDDLVEVNTESSQVIEINNGDY